MYRSVIAFIIALGFIIVPAAANAIDYQDWLPLLPESIGGMDKQGEPEGVNMDKGGQSWSSLKQEYADAEGNNLRLSLVTGTDAPGLNEFKAMREFNLETREEKIKTLEVAGYKAVLNINKKSGKGSLLIAVADDTLVIIDTTAGDREDQLVSLADRVPLAEIAGSIN